VKSPGGSILNVVVFFLGKLESISGRKFFAHELRFYGLLTASLLGGFLASVVFRFFLDFLNLNRTAAPTGFSAKKALKEAILIGFRHF